MFKYIVILLIVGISVWRYNTCIRKNNNPNFLLLSTLIQLIPLSGIILKLGSIKTNFGILSGAMDSFYAIDALWLIAIILFLFHPHKNNTLYIKNSTNRHVFCVFILLEFISLINPFNTLHFSGLPIFFRVLQLFVFLQLISKYLTIELVLKGLYDGFKWAIGLQFVLTTLFPVLHISIVNSLFNDNISDWAYRRGTPSAIGTFMHPGALALFCCMAAMFFLSCYLNKYKIADAKLRILMCLYIVFFTYSRTSYLTILGTLLFVYVVYKNRVNFKIQSLFIFGIGVALFFVILNFTPLSDLFFKSDIDVQVENRMLHYLLALGCFQESPLIGVGLNSHVHFMYNYLQLSGIRQHINDFFITNPVHNSHLIVLAETGAIGFILWCYYFISRIFLSFKYCVNKIISINIINLAFAGILIVYILYGMTGWSCFHREIYPIPIIIGFFSLLKK